MNNSLTAPINLDKICRVCLAEPKELHSIFSVLQCDDNENDNITYVYELLMNLSSIKILNEDQMPTNLCTACLILANASFKLQQQYNRSQVILKTYLAEVKDSLNGVTSKKNTSSKSINYFHDFNDSDNSLLGSHSVNVNPNDSHTVQNNLDDVHRDDSCKINNIVKCEDVDEEISDGQNVNMDCDIQVKEYFVKKEELDICDNEHDSCDNGHSVWMMDCYNKESDFEEEIDAISPEIRDNSATAGIDMLPSKSRERYENQYKIFLEWCNDNHIKIYSENALMGYFAHMAKKYSPSTLWSYYSMLKAMIMNKTNVNIANYKRLLQFLKEKAKGYTPKKAKTLLQEEIIKFLLNAPDNVYLMMKICAIFGIAGACRAEELINLNVDHIEDKDSILIVHISKTKTNRPRTFIVTADFEGVIKPIELYRKYLALRPPHTKIKRFFISYKKGKCTIQPVGIHTISRIPSKIANYLNLPDPLLYTGHCFRKTSATLFFDAGGSKENFKRHGGWKSDSVAECYVEESAFNKTKIANTILGGVHQQEQKPLNAFVDEKMHILQNCEARKKTK